MEDKPSISRFDACATTKNPAADSLCSFLGNVLCDYSFVDSWFISSLKRPRSFSHTTKREIIKIASFYQGVILTTRLQAIDEIPFLKSVYLYSS